MESKVLQKENSYCYLYLLELGISIFDSNERMVFSLKFDNPVSQYRMIRSGDFSLDLSAILKNITPYEKILVNDPSLDFFIRNSGYHTELLEEKINKMQNQKVEIIIKSEFAKNEYTAAQELRRFAIDFSTSKIREASEKLDLHIIQSINLLDELDKIINIMGARMREWYGLHFPELDHLIQSLTAYADIIINVGDRNNIKRELLIPIGFTEKKIEVIIDASRRSKGGIITTENMAILKQLAEQIKAQSELRRITSDHIDNIMEIIAPNVTELLTASVGARIIAKAGSLIRLASLPASTIQVLGAEKALFRALKTGARPPKHGLIFQNALVHSAPKWQRGKIARALASNVAIAARIDVYQHEGRDESISDKLMTRVSEIQEKYKEPRIVKEYPKGRNTFNRDYKRDDRKKYANKSKGKNKKKFGKRKY